MQGFLPSRKDDRFPLYTCQVQGQNSSTQTKVIVLLVIFDQMSQVMEIIFLLPTELGRPAYCASYCNKDRDHTTNLIGTLYEFQFMFHSISVVNSSRSSIGHF